MFGFNKVNVYVGQSLQDFIKAKDALARQQIPYTCRVEDQSQDWSGRGTMRSQFGSFGTADYDKLYYVSVKKSDSEQAEYFINKEIHS
jgi:hypothetical protein